MPLAVEPLDQLEPRRICLIKPSALGDVVQTLPVLAGLRQRWPGAHISWVINRELAPLLASHPDLDEVIEFNRRGRRGHLLVEGTRLWRRLRRGGFDLTIDLQGLARSGLMTQATSARRRVGYAHAREGATWAYTDRIALPEADMPAVPKYWHVARQFGCPPQIPPAHIEISGADRQWAAEKLAAAGRPLLAVHPGAQWVTKRWLPAHFVQLCRWGAQQFGASVVLLGGPGEAAIADHVARGLDGTIPTGHLLNLAGQTSLKQLAAITQQANVFLAGDTGPMHLAAAVGTPVVSIFTCTSPRRAGPHGPGHRIVATKVTCAASNRKNCPTMHCMAELTPVRVWPALAAALEDARGKQRQAG